MKALLAMLCSSLLALPAYAQEKKEPSAAQKKEERRKECAAKAETKRGDARRNFMKECVKGKG